MGTHWPPNASVAGIWPISSLKGKVLGPGGRDLGRFRDSGVSGRAGDIYNSTSTPNYCDEPYGDISAYVNDILSAWTEVWSISWPSTAPITAPGGRDLGGF